MKAGEAVSFEKGKGASGCLVQEVSGRPVPRPGGGAARDVVDEE